MRASKLGFGILAEYDDWQYLGGPGVPGQQNGPRIFDVQPRGVLLLQEHVNDLGERAIDYSDKPAFRIFHRDTFQPSHKAEDWMGYLLGRLPNIARMGERAAAQGKSIGLISYNEPNAYDFDNMAAYGAFEATRAFLLDPYPGLHAIVGNFGVGTTSRGLMDVFMPSLYELYKQGVYWELGLHEYWYYLPWCWMGQWQGGNIIPPNRTVPSLVAAGKEAYLLGRFQHLGLPKWVPIALTEFGCDALSEGQVQKYGLPAKSDGSPYGGLKTCIADIGRHYQASKPAEFWANNILMWADQWLQMFSQIRCAYFFSGAGPHYEGQFHPFDMADSGALFPATRNIARQGDTLDLGWRALQRWMRLYWKLRGQ